MRILFFGRKDDPYSEQAMRFLRKRTAQAQAVWSKGLANSLPEEALRWNGDVIVCFRSRFILPLSLLNNASLCAVNFHPGPPEYPGSGCINWALYDNAERYGTTAHLMNERVDAGEILDARRFPLHPADDLESLLERSYVTMLDQLFDVMERLVGGGREGLERLKRAAAHEKWRGKPKAMKHVDQLMRIDADVTREELTRRIRATRFKQFSPFIELHGMRFVLETPDLGVSGVCQHKARARDASAND